MAGSVSVVKAASGPMKVVSFEQLASLGSSTALTVPGVAVGTGTRPKVKAALISADGQSVRVRFDGTAPTATIGHLIANGDHLFVEADLSNIRIIQTAATAVVNVTYFG